MTGGLGKRIMTEEGDFCLLCLSKVVRTITPIDRMYPLRTLAGFKFCFFVNLPWPAPTEVSKPTIRPTFDPGIVVTYRL